MPLVNRTFDQLINFTRTTAATFVGSNGLIQTTPQSRNLLTFTQEFDNAAWTAVRASVTANSTAAPDGTNTADTLVEDTTASNSHRLQRIVNIPGSSIVTSVFLKAAGRNWAYVRVDDGATVRFAYFNLATGAIGTVSAGFSASITSVGNGWYRCAAVLASPSATATGNVVFGSATADNSDVYTGTGIASLFIWGAQLELGSTATDYTRNFGGLFPPRFDYDPVTLAPRGLLIEEQRTNLVLRSEEFNNVYWTPTGGTVTANATTSPDGTANADNLVEDTSTGFHRVFASPACAANTTYTFTAYVKAAGRTQVRLLETTVLGAVFDLASGTVASTDAGVTASIQNAGNGWYRCRITNTTGAGQTAYVAQIQAISAGNILYTGNGAAALSLYGAQLEAGAFATSYIPTVASQVTRTADVAAINAPNFAPWYNSAQGTFVAEFQTIFNGTAPASSYILAFDNNASKRIVYIGQAVDTASTFDGATIVSSVGDVTGSISKVASAYSTSDRAIVSNGGSVATGAVAAGYSTASLLNIAGVAATNGHIRSIRYYPSRLSNAQLQALTA